MQLHAILVKKLPKLVHPICEPFHQYCVVILSQGFSVKKQETEYENSRTKRDPTTSTSKTLSDYALPKKFTLCFSTKYTTFMFRPTGLNQILIDYIPKPLRRLSYTTL